MAESNDRPFDQAKVRDAVETLSELRTGIVITGRVVNGKVELDQSTLDDIARKYPDADVSFVAVNAPFDPRTVSG